MHVRTLKQSQGEIKFEKISPRPEGCCCMRNGMAWRGVAIVTTWAIEMSPGKNSWATWKYWRGEYSDNWYLCCRCNISWYKKTSMATCRLGQGILTKIKPILCHLKSCCAVSQLPNFSVHPFCTNKYRYVEGFRRTYATKTKGRCLRNTKIFVSYVYIYIKVPEQLPYQRHFPPYPRWYSPFHKKPRVWSPWVSVLFIDLWTKCPQPCENYFLILAGMGAPFKSWMR